MLSICLFITGIVLGSAITERLYNNSPLKVDVVDDLIYVSHHKDVFVTTLANANKFKTMQAYVSPTTGCVLPNDLCARAYNIYIARFYVERSTSRLLKDHV